MPEDSGRTHAVDHAGLKIGGFDGVVAPVGHGVRVEPVVAVDAVTCYATMAYAFAASVRTLQIDAKLFFERYLRIYFDQQTFHYLGKITFKLQTSKLTLKKSL